MQFSKKQNIIVLSSLIILLSGCSKYGYVTLNYPTEPEATLPGNIESVALMNRSLTNEDQKKETLIETIATGEIAGSDKQASSECLRGARDNMNGLHGLNLFIPEKNELFGTGTREVPELLDWNTVDAICKRENSDALLVLETFDSNSDLALTAATESVSAILSGRIPDPMATRQVRMNVVCLWRLYDPAVRQIVDQFQHTSWMSFEANAAFIPYDALPKTAYFAGEEYAFRFRPGYYKVKRKLYSKIKGPGKKQFQTGFRQSEVANWSGAIESWSEVVEVAKRKSAGRACLDIAVAYEVLGNTDLALEWAQKAYELYNDELAKSYAKILLRRKSFEY